MNLTLTTAILIASTSSQAYEPYTLTLTGQGIIRECFQETPNSCFSVQGRIFSTPLQRSYKAGETIPIHFTMSCTFDEECKVESITD